MSIELYGWDPREIDHYDLVVNTVQLDLDACVEIIVQAAKVKARSGGSRDDRARARGRDDQP